MFFFWTNRKAVRSCITYSKINLLGHLEGEIWEFSSLLILKKGYFSPSPVFQIKRGSWNLVCRLSTSHVCVFLGVFQLFRPLLQSYENVVFWSVYLIASRAALAKLGRELRLISCTWMWHVDSVVLKMWPLMVWIIHF